MKKIIFILLPLFTLILVDSCKSEKKNDAIQQDSTVSTVDTSVQTFYLVPSPDDIFGFADDKNLSYVENLLNPIENASKYNNTMYQEFNFGIYSADLAYCAANAKNEETKKYLQTVQDLSQKIGLAEIFNASLINRIEHISAQKDSLISISNDTYFDIIRYLDKYQKNSTLSIMAAGGWIECMYIVINQVEYDAENPTIQKIADQKLVISNLSKFLEQNIGDPNVKTIFDDFKPIVDLYQGLTIKKLNTSQSPKNKTGNVFIIGGNHKIIITEEEYSKLKELIIQTRNNLTLNNVTQ